MAVAGLWAPTLPLHPRVRAVKPGAGDAHASTFPRGSRRGLRNGREDGRSTDRVRLLVSCGPGTARPVSVAASAGQALVSIVLRWALARGFSASPLSRSHAGRAGRRRRAHAGDSGLWCAGTSPRVPKSRGAVTAALPDPRSGPGSRKGDGHRIGAAERAGMNGTRIEGRRVGGKGVAGSWRRCFVPVLAGCGLRTVEGTADVVHPPLCPAGRAFALAPGPGVRAVRKACQCERHSAARPRNDGAVRVGAGCCIQASPEDSLTARRYAAGAVAWCFLKTRLKAASDPYPTRSAISMIGSPVRASSWRASCMRQ